MGFIDLFLSGITVNPDLRERLSLIDKQFKLTEKEKAELHEKVTSLEKQLAECIQQLAAYASREELNMTFSDDLKKFSSNTTSQMDALQKERTDEFLLNFLGEDFRLITRYEFDSTISRFCNVEAPESVLAKLREANYLRVAE